MYKKRILITGANGEIGQGLINTLAKQGDVSLFAIDIAELDYSIRDMCDQFLCGDILDRDLLIDFTTRNDFDTVFHLAALLSTTSEKQPRRAHQVNVEGTINVLDAALNQSRRRGCTIKVIFPSSIAVYGLPSLDLKIKVGKVKENEWCEPTTMYGANKLYCEHLGCYYSEHYRRLDRDQNIGGIDFRGIRFPGLISTATIPFGGTSDYLPEMLHSAARNEHYSCFVSENTKMPFMVMPDAIKALVSLENIPIENLSRRVYNVTAFNPSANAFYERLINAFPDFRVIFKPDLKRESIVNSWPIDMDDASARSDWDWAPTYDLGSAINCYLIPFIKKRYELKPLD